MYNAQSYHNYVIYASFSTQTLSTLYISDLKYIMHATTRQKILITLPYQAVHTHEQSCPRVFCP
jgi:hypothetical protein